MSTKYKDNSLLEIAIFLLMVFANILIIASTDLGNFVLTISKQYTELLMLFGIIITAGAATVQRFVTISNKILTTVLLLTIGYILSLLLAILFLNGPPRP